ncbi:Hypothetical predicted protein [Pelobates cultripes]|uniref:Uncharacterized protein n=1 Tax=Pelobates cultripes TaxID=61616 RepID=A0AAD1WBI9_PELCU|nr:Hypothetical predicted protein [Pelobates cultripes]
MPGPLWQPASIRELRSLLQPGITTPPAPQLPLGAHCRPIIAQLLLGRSPASTISVSPYAWYPRHELTIHMFLSSTKLSISLFHGRPFSQTHQTDRTATCCPLAASK